MSFTTEYVHLQQGYIISTKTEEQFVLSLPQQTWIAIFLRMVKLDSVENY